MRHARLPLAAAAAALLLAGPARADLVRLHDGKTIEGKVSRSAKKVNVKGYKGKTVSYAESEVKFVEEGRCSWDVAADMAKEIPADASDALFIEKRLQIARYLKERREYCAELEELERKEYEAILKRSPDQEEARVGLGHVKWGPWWFKSEKERDAKRKGAPPAEMEPLGFVKSKKSGMWETKEDAEAIEAGKVRFKGKWMTEDEKKIAQGYARDEKGNWVFARDVKNRERAAEVEKALGEKPVTVVSSKHFLLISWLDTNETAQMKELCEKTYADHRRLLGIPLPKEEEGEDDLFPEPIEVFILVDGLRKDRWVAAYGPGLGWSPEVITHRTEKGAGWHDLQPAPYLLSSGRDTEKNRPRDRDEDEHQSRSTHTSQVGRILLDRLRGPNHPAWLMEGNAFLAEIGANESADCCYVSMTKYREETANKAGSKAKYFDFMKTQIGAGLDRTLRQIFSLELNDLDWADCVKSWSFLSFLVANHPNEFREALRRPFPEVEEITPAQIEAAILAKKPKDPSAANDAQKKVKDEGAVPTSNVRVSGPGAQAVTQGSKEERAVRAASAEAWLQASLKKDLDTLEKEWKAWIRSRTAAP